MGGLEGGSTEAEQLNIPSLFFFFFHISAAHQREIKFTPEDHAKKLLFPPPTLQQNKKEAHTMLFPLVTDADGNGFDYLRYHTGH